MKKVLSVILSDYADKYGFSEGFVAIELNGKSSSVSYLPD